MGKASDTHRNFLLAVVCAALLLRGGETAVAANSDSTALNLSREQTNAEGF